MALDFSKMHGLGNDFMVVDATRQAVSFAPEKIRELSNRHTGIGFDQLLIVGPPDRDDADFSYRIFNADGGEVDQCGNGARCFADFVRRKELTDKTSIRVSTNAGLLVLKVQADGQVQVDMGSPVFAPADIPFDAATQQDRYILTVADRGVELGAVSMGNPHAVQLVENVDSAPVETLGPAIESHPAFPDRVNVGFMQIVDAGHVRLRVYERGAGETMACGSGACAAVVVGRLWGLLDETVEVALRGGKLIIQWAGNNASVQMTGPAAHVFDGQLTDEFWKE